MTSFQYAQYMTGSYVIANEFTSLTLKSLE